MIIGVPSLVYFPITSEYQIGAQGGFQVISGKAIFFFALISVWCVLPLPMTVSMAQTQQGALAGAVSDSSGARIAGATISVETEGTPTKRQTKSNGLGEFRLESLPPGHYRVTVRAPNFATTAVDLDVAVGSVPTLSVNLKPETVTQRVDVSGAGASLTSQPLETTSSIEKTAISAKDLATLPLAHRSFANIAYLSPMTQPVEPSDPTKARITAVAFAGSSGLNVDLSVDGGDNNDDYIGGFLQNYSPDAMQEFTVRTAQFDADTSRTNGGSVLITTRRGGDQWHGDLSRSPQVFAQKLFEFMLDACEKHEVQQ